VIGKIWSIADCRVGFETISKRTESETAGKINQRTQEQGQLLGSFEFDLEIVEFCP